MMRNLISILFDWYCNVMLAVCTVVYFMNHELEWGLFMIVYLVIVAFGDLQREIRRKMTLNLDAKIPVHNWIFVDEDGKPVVFAKGNRPPEGDI